MPCNLKQCHARSGILRMFYWAALGRKDRLPISSDLLLDDLLKTVSTHPPLVPRTPFKVYSVAVNRG